MKPRKFQSNASYDDKNPRRGRRPQRKTCALCADKIKDIDYKDTAKIKRYMTEKGKIVPRRTTGVCAGHQRALTIAIKRARTMALLPYKND